MCKQMKRHGVSEKHTVDPDHEPDLYKISEEHPLPLQCPDDESILLQHILKEGPKGRMPVYFHQKKITRPLSPDATKTVLNTQAFGRSPCFVGCQTDPSLPPQLAPAPTIVTATHPSIGFTVAPNSCIIKSILPGTRGAEDHAPVHISPLLQSSFGHHMSGLSISPKLAQLVPLTQYAASFAAAAAAMTKAHFQSMLDHVLASTPPTIPRYKKKQLGTRNILAIENTYKIN